MTTYPLPTLAAAITDAGITAPTFSDVRASLRATFQGIYGSDAYIEPDSQDGQWIDAIAKAIDDANASCIAVYNAFSPATARGTGLASIVKLNGIKKAVPSASTAPVNIGGQAQTAINGGVVSDVNGVKWALPPNVTIPDAGTIQVTVTCLTIGAVAAATGQINKIETPTLGWQTVSNPSAATPGSPVESDAALRRRQSISAALPANSPIAAIDAALAALAGVTLHKVYENDTGSTDANGESAHSIAAVVVGAADQDIVNTIGGQKTPGTHTDGTSSATYTDARGLPNTIRFYRPTLVPMTVVLDLTRLAGWGNGTLALIKQAIVDYGSLFDIGQDVFWTKLFTPANLEGTPVDPTFKLTGLRIARDAGSPAAADVTISYIELTTWSVGNITINVT